MTTHRLRDVALVLTSNVDKIIDPDEHPVRLCNYVDVYKNNFIHNDLRFKKGSATSSEIKKFAITVDDVIITKDSETADDIGVPALVKSTADDLVCGYHLSILRSDRRRIIGPFLYWHLLSKKTQEDLGNAANGVTRFGLTLSGIKGIPINLPDLSTQREIADFLDRETARIDLLIEKKQKLVDAIAPRFEALIHEARGTSDWRRFGFCVETKARPISNDDDTAYVRLGLYNRGRGFFKKPETAFDDLGDSSFFFVEKGDLVFSGQFAWEGAVGLVSEMEQGCVVSHRYPVYTGIKGVLSEYLFAYFRSHRGQFLMDNCSRGAAGRNRPLNTRILEKESILIPSLPLQKEIVKVIEFERRLKGKITPSIDRLKEYRSALITAAVTGQIDVTTYAKSGTTDRRLDAIQEEIGA